MNTSISIPVKDVGTGSHNQIAHAAEVLRRSPDRRKVFQAICRGKKKVKTPKEIASRTNLSEIRVLQEALILANNDIIRKYRIKGKGLVYEKDPFYGQHKRKILHFALHKKALEKFPTNYNPASRRDVSVRITIPKQMVNVEQLTIDDIDSFSEVRNVKPSGTTQNVPIEERKFKEALKKIIGEEGTFQDWGGERNDLFSTRLLLGRERVTGAFGLKGRGTKGTLVPKKMGKRGDQIQRLLGSTADVFLIQYWGQIDESILEQMRLLATAKSWAEHKKVYYGIIDGQDSQRLIKAYPEAF